MIERNGDVTANDVSHGAQLGDAFCAELLARSGRLIGESLAPLVNLLNPAVVVLAGALAHSGEILLAAVREAIYRRSHPLATRDLQHRALANSPAPPNSSARRRLAVEEVFARVRAREWITVGSPRRQPSFEAFLAEAKTQRRKAAARMAVPPLRPP